MSYYLQNDGKLGEQVASNGGWGDFGRWAESLDEKVYGEIAGLYQQGWCDEPKALIKQLTDAMKSHQPIDADTKEVAATLLDVLKTGKAKIVVSITDGMGEDDTDE